MAGWRHLTVNESFLELKSPMKVPAPQRAGGNGREVGARDAGDTGGPRESGREGLVSWKV